MSKDPSWFSVLENVTNGIWLQIKFSGEGNIENLMVVFRQLEFDGLFELPIHDSLIMGAVDDTHEWDWRGEDRRIVTLRARSSWSQDRFKTLAPWIAEVKILG